MSRKIKGLAASAICLLMLAVPPAEGLGLEGMGMKAGLNLTRQQSINFTGQVGGQFDTARLVLGSHLDLGSLMLDKMHLVPGGDVVLEDALEVFSINTEIWYFFHRSPTSRGYTGGGIGVHLHRYDNTTTTSNQTRVTVNVPFGYEQKLAGNMGWFTQLKLVIADDETDSSLQLHVGLAFGAWE